MHIIRNYVLGEFIKQFLLSMLVFTFVLVTGNLIKLADLVINKGINIIYIGLFFLYMLPYLLSFSIPMAALAGTLFTFGRLAGDNEIDAMHANGISLYRIISPVMLLAFILSLASVPLNDKVLTRSHLASRKLIKEIGIKQPLAYMEPGTFIKAFQGYIIFIYEIDGDEFKNIRIYQTSNDGPTRTIVASSGKFISTEHDNLKIRLTNGTSEEPNPSNPRNFYKLNFKTYTISLNLKKDQIPGKIDKKPKEMTLAEIKDEIRTLGDYNIDVMPLRAEFHKRIAISFASFVFVLIGIPLAVRVRRGERSICFGVSLCIIISYWMLLAGAKALALKGAPFVGPLMWIPNIVMAVCGFILLRRAASR